MDMRNGDMYESRDAALAAGVPISELGETEVVEVEITSGPFKGRRYRRNALGQMERVKSEAEKERHDVAMAPATHVCCDVWRRA